MIIKFPMQLNFNWLALFCTLLIMAACNGKKSKSNSEQKDDAITLESIQLVDLSGNAIDVTELEDKTVFINFWATWCKPCIQEMPTIENAQTLLKDRNVVFLLASNETVEQIEKFKTKRKFELQFVRVENLEALNIQALPATYIFNPQGELVFSEVGYRMWDTPENINLITKDSNL